MKDLEQLIEQLDESERQRVGGQASPLAAGRKREEILVKGLQLVGQAHGVKFKEPLGIDSRGDFMLSLDSAGQSNRFGPTLVGVLNRFSPRCGLVAGTILLESSSWCYMNHFEVERLLRHVASERPKVTLTLVDASHGYDDYDVTGHPDVDRVCIGHQIRKGDYFNVYGAGGKRGERWRGDLLPTMREVLGLPNVEDQIEIIAQSSEGDGEPQASVERQ